MKKQFNKMSGPLLLKKILTFRPPVPPPPSNEKGSIILAALMVLVIMTVIGLMSVNTVVTENFIVRNQAYYKQNQNMVESAVMVGLEQFLQLPPDTNGLVNVNALANDWLNDVSDPQWATDWYAVDSSAQILNDNNSLNINDAVNIARNLADRGETGAGNLRIGFVGWLPVTFQGGGGPSLVVTGTPLVWRRGRIIGEYVSLNGGADNGFGLARMEIGVLRQVSPSL